MKEAQVKSMRALKEGKTYLAEGVEKGYFENDCGECDMKSRDSETILCHSNCLCGLEATFKTANPIISYHLEMYVVEK